MPANPKVQSTDSPGLPWVPRCPSKAWYLIWHSQELCFQGRLQESPARWRTRAGADKAPQWAAVGLVFYPRAWLGLTAAWDQTGTSLTLSDPQFPAFY